VKAKLKEISILEEMQSFKLSNSCYKWKRPLIVLIFLLFNFTGFPQRGADTRIKDLYLEANSLKDSDLRKAFELSDHSLKLLPKSNDLKIQSSAYSVAGVLHKNNGNFDQSLKFHFESLSLRVRIEDSILISNSYSNLGGTYFVLDQPEEAFRYYMKCALIREEIGATHKLAKAYSNLGNVYSDLPSNSSSREKQLQDSSYFYYRKALDYIDPEDYSRTNSNIYMNIGIQYRDLNELDSAAYFLSKAEEIQRYSEDLRGLSKSLHNLGIILEEKNELEKAQANYEEALKLSDSAENLQTSFDIVRSLLSLHKQIGSNEYDDYFDRFLLMNDSLNKIKTKEEIATQGVLFEVDQKEQKNQLLGARNSLLEQKNATDKRENQLLWIILIASGILLLGIIALFLFYRQRQVTLKLEDQNKINQMIREQDKKYFTAILEGQEKERKRVSEELHDRMGGLLSTVKIHLGKLGEKMNRQSASYKTTENLLNDAIDEIRKISNDMVSGVLVNFGLVAATRDLVLTVNSADKLNISVNSFGMEERLPNQIEINCFRIIQESITNTLKHSNADSMKILLNRKKNALILTIKDNGIGFDWDSKKMESGLGLKSIKRRIDTLNGELVVNSGEGSGVNYSITIPIND
jgi:signal transduction histidine kinase